MRVICAILLLVNIVVCGGCVSGQKASKLFGNMTYHIPASLVEKEITLVDGKYETWPNDIYYDDKYVYGDFNRDGLRDAAVIVLESTGGGGNQCWNTLAFLINDGKKLAHQASINLDDGAVIHSMKSKNGKVYIDMNVHQSGDCSEGPSNHIREAYEYPGPGVFTSRAGSYIFGESSEGIRGTGY